MSKWATLIGEIDGQTERIEVYADAPLGARWWEWTEYKWHTNKDGLSFDMPVARHRALPIPLRFPDQLGAHLVSLDDGRLMVLLSHDMFCITDDDDAMHGAAEHYKATIDSLAEQRSLI